MIIGAHRLRDPAAGARAVAEWAAHRAAGDGTPYVALLGDWTPAFLAAFAGLAASGWAVGVLDPEWGEAELGAALGQLDPCLWLVADHLDRETRRHGWHQLDTAPPGWRAYARGPLRDPVPPATPEGVFYVGFTSGSSGRPKAFARTHASWWHSFQRFSEYRPIDPAGTVLIPGPLSSSHFLFGALHAQHVGATVQLAPLTALDRQAAVYVVPTMLAALAREDAGPQPGPGVIYCAGAALEAPVNAATRRRFPHSDLVEYYGASELSFVAIRTEGDGTPPGSVGRAFPGVQITIRDPGGAPLPPGEPGLIAVRSSLVFSGYRGTAPASAARHLDDGWLTVGDHGSLDADGYLRVAGRGTNLIIVGGANVQPEEVEQVIATHPGVAECVVVGLTHPVWGEVVCAAVLPAPGAALTRAQLRSHVSARLTRGKRPRRYVLLEAPPPVGHAGKVDRAAVRGLVAQSPPHLELR